MHVCVSLHVCVCVCGCMHKQESGSPPPPLCVSLAPGRALAFVCNVCNVSVCICVSGFEWQEMEGAWLGGVQHTE